MDAVLAFPRTCGDNCSKYCRYYFRIAENFYECILFNEYMESNKRCDKCLSQKEYILKPTCINSSLENSKAKEDVND